MTKKMLALTLGLSGTALAAALVLPAVAQESLLPEGFGKSADTPAPRPAPTPSPSPSSTPAPSSTAVPKGGSAGATALAPSTVATLDSGDTDTAMRPAMARKGPPASSNTTAARRAPAVDAVGPLTPETGGMAPDAFCAANMRRRHAACAAARAMGRCARDIATASAHVSRSAAARGASPRCVCAALRARPRCDRLHADRGATCPDAGLLLRLGESTTARMIVQSVDYDRATPRLVATAQQTYLANADPSGLCPYVPAGLAHGDEQSWRLAAAMCAGMSGEAGPAGWAIGRVRSSGKISNFDILLAERVLGATGAGRRSTTIEWDKVGRLTSWRFGLATATGIDIPAPLRATEAGSIRSWTVLAPMTPMGDRIAAAPYAASRGVLSSEAYVSLLSAASSEEEPPEALAAQTDLLRSAFSGANAADRYTAMRRNIGPRAPARRRAMPRLSPPREPPPRCPPAPMSAPIRGSCWDRC
ncbi:hypothetical protein [Sphingopyxis terrae]|uniref:hypothetical protein n=1 Tax=Sphingopyxis terrae TaxID=33052 RepID=UPI003636E86E